MRTKLLGYVIALTVTSGLCGVASAQPKNRGGGKSTNDKTIDKQMEWEKQVMGDDSAKQSDMKKIAAAQKLADEAAKHPPPIAAPKQKDPSKEGVRAKQEASIGLPIASDQDTQAHRKSAGAKRTAAAQPTSSANDELGALVATSLAERRSPSPNVTGPSANKVQSHARGSASKGRGRKGGGAPSSPSALDQMFAASGQ